MSYYKTEKFTSINLKGTFEEIKAHPILPNKVKGFLEILLIVIQTDDAFYHNIIYVHFISVSKNRPKYFGYEPLISDASVL